jgi:hypothetical protein
MMTNDDLNDVCGCFTQDPSFMDEVTHELLDMKDTDELLEMEATINAFDELCTKVPYFKNLVDGAELECSSWQHTPPSAISTLVVDSIFATLQSFAEKRADLQLKNMTEISLPTKDHLVAAVEDELENQAELTQKEHLHVQARVEWNEDWKEAVEYVRCV